MKRLYSYYQIDGELSESILENINTREKAPKEDHSADHHEFPTIDGKTVIDGTSTHAITIPYAVAEKHIHAIDPLIDLAALSSRKPDGTIDITKKGLEHLGLSLMPYVAFGILNGGSATSYVDSMKNSSFYPPLYSYIQEQFPRMSHLYSNKAKGLTPAYINPDGTPGYSFLELKMRALLIQSIQSSHVISKPCSIPLFQMTSDATHDQLLTYYQTYKNSPMLKELIAYSGFSVTDVRSAKQPLISAFTSKIPGEQRSVFTHAYGDDNHLLALPGGHGQNFYVLQDIYRELLAEGKRFVYLVNVDNLGNIPYPAYVAITALTGCDGSFEFSYKSPIDIKGGILVRNSKGSLTCKDIGAAISSEEVRKAEDSGKPILFNCATGLFNLTYLTEHLDCIINNLPLRVSEQHKDAGEYAQAEQITWEIIGLMEHPTIIAVRKQDRFLAAKLLSESIMTTEASLFVPRLLKEHPDYHDFCDFSLTLEKGFHRLMKKSYGMTLQNDRWDPIALNTIIDKFA